MQSGPEPYAILGLIAGVFCSLVDVTGASFAPHAHLPFARAVELFAVILCPIVYGIIGGVAAVVSTLLYNLVSRWVGGVEVELNLSRSARVGACCCAKGAVAQLTSCPCIFVLPLAQNLIVGVEETQWFLWFGGLSVPRPRVV